MLRQRPPGTAPAIRASAEALPLADGAVDAAMALMTLHHWADWRAGIAEMRRVARARVVVWTFDPDAMDALWVVRDYLPEIADFDRARCPSPAEVADALGGAEIREVAIPRDCEDGVLAAFYARPEAYLDPAVRAGMSPFHVLDAGMVDAAMARLADDLRSGAWEARHGAVRELDALDAGYRLLVG
jgi:SAM-dependent methyltransferase